MKEVKKIEKKGIELKRNQAKVCSFFVQGKCNRGDTCPYRHENITEEDLKSMQKGQARLEDKILARFNGEEDPLEKKILEKVKEREVPKPPKDETISTLFVGGITDAIKKEDLSESFEKYGPIAALRLIVSKRCAFVAYKKREDCENAMTNMYGKLAIKGQNLKLLWAKSQL